MADTNSYQDKIANMGDMSPDELAALETELVGEFDKADEADDLDAMAASADAIDSVRAEQEKRNGDEEEPATPQVQDAPAPATATPAPVSAAADPVEDPDGSIKRMQEIAPDNVAEKPRKQSEVEGADSDESGTPKAAGAIGDDGLPVNKQPSGDIVQDEKEGEHNRAEDNSEIPDEKQHSGDHKPGEDVEVDSTDAAEKQSALPDEKQPSGDSEQEGTEPKDRSSAEGTTAAGQSQEDSQVDIPEDRKPVATQPATTVVAGADIPGRSAGTPFDNAKEVAEAFTQRLHSMKRAVGGDGEQHVVATVTASASDERSLDPGDMEGNFRKIEAVTSPQALMASGGYCAPLETRYDIFGTGSTARPVRDSLAGFQARRGGIRYTQPPKVTDLAGAVALWTAANDANPTNPTTKPCLKINCSPELTATVDAITLCLTFGNLMSRAYPELVDRNNQLALVQQARFAETTLLAKMAALSTSVTSGFHLGTARDFLLAVARGAAAYRYRYRVSRDQQLRVLAPEWVKDAMVADLLIQIPGDNATEQAEAKIANLFASLRVTVAWHMDGGGFADEVAASAIDDFPATFDWFLYAEGAFLFLDGGTLDLGIVRDSALVATNDYKMFVETFEGVAKIGADAIKVTTTTHVAGATAGTTNTISTPV